MKKDLITHFTFLVAFFLFITIFRRWFDISFITFWVGGVVGTLLPDADHLIYVYLSKPHELTSQRVNNLLAGKNVKKSWDLLAITRTERKDLIFHSAYFQVIFIILSFLVISSSGNYFGRGLVLAFMLHLLIDQVVDLVEVNSLDNWFGKLIVITDKLQRRVYLVVNLIVLLVFGFYF